MQLTRFDRWLLESFVQETHVYTLSPPTKIPHGIREVPLLDTPGRRFQHHFIASTEQAADQLISTLRQSGQMFSTQVVDRRTWYTPLIAPKGQSVTWRIVWILLVACGLFYATMYVRGLWDNPEFRKQLHEARKVLKN